MKARTSSPSWCTQATLIVLFVFSLDNNGCTAARILVNKKSSAEFIRTSCNATQYPRLCLDSLLSYDSTIQPNLTQLAQTAILVSLSSARNASATVSTIAAAGGMGPREAAAVKDCMVTVGDSVQELQRSLDAMGSLGGKGRKGMSLQMDNVQTWVSAALTDENTCMDGFAYRALNGEIKRMIRGQIVKVAQLISNALALINGLASNISP